MSDFHVTVLLHHFDLRSPTFSPRTLRDAGVTHVTVPVMWCHVEPEQGHFVWDRYDEILTRLVDEGFGLIILLDAGGRYEFDDNGFQVGGNTVLPHFFRIRDEFYATDFYGSRTQQISFSSAEGLDAVATFYAAAVAHFDAAFGKSIFAFALGIQSEFEIKYGQDGYRWRDYGDAARRAYAEEGHPPPPIVDYGRSIGGDAPPLPGYAAWLAFRERQLCAFVARLASIIRQAGHRSIGYFGEVFTSHDAIMGLSVVGELGHVLDAAVVDYNFYDGWVNQPNPWKVPMMINYIKHLGYAHVFGGYYVERWRLPVGEPGSPVDPTIFPVIAQSLFEIRAQGGIDGVEIGGFGDMARDLRQLRAPMMYAAINNPPRARKEKRYRIGLFASHATFNWYVGEHDRDVNIHAEALTRTFEMFAGHPEYEVVVVSEKTLRLAPDVVTGLDAIYVSHQPVIDDETLDRLKTFAQAGVLVQDVRLGEWNEDGAFRGEWMNELFGIGAIGWKNGGHFTYRGEPIAMPPATHQAASHALLAPVAGRLDVLSTTEPEIGLVLRSPHTIALGYVPALIEGATSERWREIFLAALAETIANVRRTPAPEQSVPADPNALQ